MFSGANIISLNWDSNSEYVSCGDELPLIVLTPLAQSVNEMMTYGDLGNGGTRRSEQSHLISVAPVSNPWTTRGKGT